MNVFIYENIEEESDAVTDDDDDAGESDDDTDEEIPELVSISSDDAGLHIPSAADSC